MTKETKPVVGLDRAGHFFGSGDSDEQPDSFLTVTAAKLAKRALVMAHLQSHDCPFLVDLYKQDAVSDGGVARRSIESISADDCAALLREARRMNYPAFIMGDQIVVFFTENAVVEQVSGPPVIRV